MNKYILKIASLLNAVFTFLVLLVVIVRLDSALLQTLNATSIHVQQRCLSLE